MSEDWHIFKGNQAPHQVENWPTPPPWRKGWSSREMERGRTFQISEEEIDLVNAALYLRRPLLVTGDPGVGKSSLAEAIAYELSLGKVLHWPISSITTIQEGLYYYDAIGRLHESQLPGNQKIDIGKYIRLGPMGTALYPFVQPRVLLLDEIDKSNMDFPNDLLNILEVGEFEIRELSRVKDDWPAGVSVLCHSSDERVIIPDGWVRSLTFPIIVMTSNREREFPAPFLRRCIHLEIKQPDESKLQNIVNAHFNELDSSFLEKCGQLTKLFLARRERGLLATDQLLNAIYLSAQQGIKMDLSIGSKDHLVDTILKYLNQGDE